MLKSLLPLLLVVGPWQEEVAAKFEEGRSEKEVSSVEEEVGDVEEAQGPQAGATGRICSMLVERLATTDHMNPSR